MVENIIYKNEYNLLLSIKKRTDESMRKFFARKNSFVIAPIKGILDLSNLKITGGLSDLSSKMDEYLYS
ncbi:MAG: hypothetical protein AAB636_01820 [Patescibacteria group bacterium]